MPEHELHLSQFGIVRGKRQPESDLVTMIEPRTRFSPEARKGTLSIVVETDQHLTRGSTAYQLVTRTLQQTFYRDRSLSITSSLKAAIRNANKALYQHNFSVPVHQRTYLGLTCAVIKGNDLFVAQVAPAQMYVMTEGTLRALPSRPSVHTRSPTGPSLARGEALGSSLFAETNLYRCLLHPHDTMVVCSNSLARLLPFKDVERLLQTPDQEPHTIVEYLHDICQQHAISDAHALVIRLRPVPRPMPSVLPFVPTGPRNWLSLLSFLMASPFTWMKGRAGLWWPKRGTGRAEGTPAARRQQREYALSNFPEQPDLPVAPLPRPRPLDLDEPVGVPEHRPSRRTSPTRSHSRQQRLPPPNRGRGSATSTAMDGEKHGDENDEETRTSAPSPQLPIDLSHLSTRTNHASPYRPRRQRRPLTDMPWHEKLLLPFQIVGGALGSAGQKLKPERQVTLAPRSSLRSETGLSQHPHEKPRFPWLILLVLVLSVTSLVLYGVNLSYKSAEQRNLEYLDQASQHLLAVSEAPDYATAVEYLDYAGQSLDQVRASSVVTQTNVTLWLRFQEVESEYERALGAIKRQTFFEEPTVLATHPLPTGHFASIVVPPFTSHARDPHAIEAMRFLYALDSDKSNARLYRIPREGGEPEIMLSSHEETRSLAVGSLRAIAWRIDNIVVVDESQQTNDFGYYFRHQGIWEYTRLGGSEVWTLRGRLDIETYEGNLYFWGAEAEEVIKYTSGHYGDIPVLWLETRDIDNVDLSTAIDMAIDGHIYLLLPDGHIQVFNAGRFERTISPEPIDPPLTSVTRFFLTGPTEEGSIYLLDTLKERVIQLDKTSGQVIQQMRMRPDSPLRLNQLTDLYVDDSRTRPVLYLVNGRQIIRATVPPPPSPLQYSPSTPPEEEMPPSTLPEAAPEGDQTGDEP